MDKIELKFINHSKDINDSNDVIFQKNVAEDFGELSVPWFVIENVGVSQNHPFGNPLKIQAQTDANSGD